VDVTSPHIARGCLPANVTPTLSQSIHACLVAQTTSTTANRSLSQDRSQNPDCAGCGLLLRFRYYLSTYGRWAFSYAGPCAWNSLPEHLRAPDL